MAAKQVEAVRARCQCNNPQAPNMGTEIKTKKNDNCEMR